MQTSQTCVLLLLLSLRGCDAALTYELDPRRAVAQLGAAAATLAVPERETWNVRENTQLYVSRLNDDCPMDDAGEEGKTCGVMLNVHAGFLLEGSRFSVGAAGAWLANTYHLAVYSVGYRLASQGATYAQTLDDIRTSLVWLRARFPRRPLVVFGASMGAGLVLSLLRSNTTLPHVDLAVLDSPYACMQTFEAQANANARTKALVDNLGKKLSDSPIWAYPTRRGEEMTPDCGVAPRFPTVVLHSELDPIVPSEQAKSLEGIGNLSVCVTPGGLHVQTLSRECRRVVKERMEEETRVALEPSGEWTRAAAEAQAEAAYAVATAAARLAPAQLVLAYLCVVTVDPLLYQFLDCEV